MLGMDKVGGALPKGWMRKILVIFKAAILFSLIFFTM